MNLILIEPHEVDEGGLANLSGDRARHLRSVLKVEVQQCVRVGMLNGPRGTAVVVAMHDNLVALRCEWQADVPAPPVVDLLLALPRPKVMRRLWAQIAALGAGQIILTNADRVERDYFDAHTLTEGEYRPLLVEGLQQAQDTRLPTVSIHRRFRPLVEDQLDTLCRDSLRLVADPSGTASIGDVVRAQHAERVLLAIGPEGGWNRFELDLLDAHRFVRVGIGPRTLRSDTACVALLALTHAAIVARITGGS